MTDPGFADRTYLEPLDLDGVTGVLERERPDALLPTMGGQTALNLARELHNAGVLDELGVELIGARIDAIARAEDRLLFKQAVESCGLQVPSSRIVTAVNQLDGWPTPAVVRPAFTLGGHGGGFVSTAAELVAQVERGLAESPIGQVLVEESVRGWDEFELEVVRDHADNVVIVCSIENLDPMGVHTGDSVTVAPQMTLSDEAYQELRDAAISVIRAVGVDTGGSNIQFARHRITGELRVIEMNPRVSRSSALASKATGYPIAKVAAKLAVGYTLDEIPNDLTGTTPASFEPTLDYVVVKFPRFAFEKFAGADRTLGTQMKSVGESMGIGRTFVEAFLKARRGLEIDPEWRPENLHPWFAAELERAAPEGGAVVYRRVDSCAGEVAAASNYFYSTRGETDEQPPTAGRSVVILGSGPNRIGQGIEFDYCCVHAAQSFRAQGYEAVMVNCNPETVSTDYDTSDRLYFEPLDEEAVLAVLERERPVGVCIQFGGQTPLKLARAIERAGFRILGTPFDAIDLAEDRERFGPARRVDRRPLPGVGIASTAEQATTIAERIGYPVLVRPSYVLGGRAMRVCYSDGDVREAMEVVDGAVLVDRFLENAIELDVDALCDGSETYVAAVMEHIEEAGIHSGDSSCVLPAPSDDERVRDAVRRLGPALGVIGLLNVQACDRRRRGLRARGESPGLAHRAVRVESDRRQHGRRRLPACRGLAALLARASARVQGRRVRLPRQGGRPAVRTLPRRRSRARPRDALDRRGNGERRRLRHCVRQGRTRGRPQAPDRRHGVPHRPRRRQDRRRRPRALARGARVRADRHCRHRTRPRRGRHRRRRRRQGHARRRAGTGKEDRPHRQHAGGRQRPP